MLVEEKKNKSLFLDLFDRFFNYFIINFITAVENFLVECGKGIIFFWESFVSIFTPPYNLREIVRHMEFIGNRSFFIIFLTAVFTGMALTVQSVIAFQKVGTASLVGAVVFITITREIGPTLTGLIVAARAGGAMAARLGTMRVSEQIDAITVTGLDPKKHLISPRIISSIIVMPFLCGLFDVFAMIGSYFLYVSVLDLDGAIFWEKVQTLGKLSDIAQGMFKSGIFGLIFSGLCTYKGFFATGGAKGVGEATNAGVVSSMVLIIIVNFFVSNIFIILKNVLGML